MPSSVSARYVARPSRRARRLEQGGARRSRVAGIEPMAVCTPPPIRRRVAATLAVRAIRREMRANSMRVELSINGTSHAVDVVVAYNPADCLACVWDDRSHAGASMESAAPCTVLLARPVRSCCVRCTGRGYAIRPSKDFRPAPANSLRVRTHSRNHGRHALWHRHDPRRSALLIKNPRHA